MFKIEEERCDYGRLLMPPAGYDLEMAVGTTYSLDLETLTFAAMAAGMGEDTDSVLRENPLYGLQALTAVTRKVVVFYETGRILVSASGKNNPLYQLLESLTVPVSLVGKSEKDIPSFHPKTWLLSYRAHEDHHRRFRFIVMSRNLTFDRSWDTVVSFDGISVAGKQEKSVPISHFLGFLESHTMLNPAQYKIVHALQQQVQYVDFLTPSPSDKVKPFFTDFTIMPMGIGRTRYDLEHDQWLSSQNDSSFHEMVIFSPFISREVIRMFNQRTALTDSQRILITRKSELSKLDAGTAGNFSIYTLRDEVVDGESVVSEDSFSGTAVQKQDIHAKMMFFRKKNSPCSLYLGSMNVSWNGFYRNVEMDIRFDGQNRYMGPSVFLDDIFGPDYRNHPEKNPFELMVAYGQPEDGNQASDTLEKIYKGLSHAAAEAKAIVNDEGNYDVTVTFSEGHAEVSAAEAQVTITPITCKMVQQLESTVIFRNLSLLELTSYYQIEISDVCGNRLNRILQIQTEGIPVERDKMIYGKIIDKKEKLYEYLSLLLSDDPLQTFMENRSPAFGEGRDGHTVVLPAVYEKMLEASLHHRERFHDIKSLMDMLPEGHEVAVTFKELYSTFRKALNMKEDE